ncbi:hypothetical protein RRG08_042154 [Elysia crispata]|uniref:Uncharacterized protein n=1 Tax=Elysia crispata TaxID=231223 RepID=A0AAE1ACR8_9GAST|nr:hypothetical protein RRG08_042154 [Elysia crispata]
MERNLGYTTIISDGHSKTHSEILQLDPYAGFEVVKQKIGLLQAYYKKSVAGRCSHTAELRKKIVQRLKHSYSTDDKPQHEDCSVGKDSWCFLQRALAYGKTPPTYQGKSS